jgi:segregation and condensation protein B
MAQRKRSKKTASSEAAVPAQAEANAPDAQEPPPLGSAAGAEPDPTTSAWPEGEAAPESTAPAWPWPEGDTAAAEPPAPADEPAEGFAETTEPEPPPAGSRLPAIIESLLFASDKPLGLPELKRLLGERDGKKVSAAVEELTQQRKGTGIEVAVLATGWLLRTNPDHAAWVSRLLVGKPMRLSRAMLETLAIVAYRQPVTRPEIDDIRGVDCGPVLRTLLDRGLVRIIGKKEEVGRPILYGTTPEFLRIFNLRELAELPTLREFYDLSAEDQSRVEAEHGPEPEPPPSATSPKPEVALGGVSRGELPPEAEETDPLLHELDAASLAARKILRDIEPPAAESPTPETEQAAAEPAAGESLLPSPPRPEE